jgi:hypothetical protein
VRIPVYLGAYRGKEPWGELFQQARPILDDLPEEVAGAEERRTITGIDREKRSVTFDHADAVLPSPYLGTVDAPDLLIETMRRPMIWFRKHYPKVNTAPSPLVKLEADPSIPSREEFVGSTELARLSDPASWGLDQWRAYREALAEIIAWHRRGGGAPAITGKAEAFRS